MSAHTGARFPILADPTAVTANDYGVYNLLRDGLAAPATYIIEPDGEILWSYIGSDIADRPTPQELLQHARDLLED